MSKYLKKGDTRERRVRIDQEISKKIEQEAEKLGVSFNYFLNSLLEEHISETSKKFHLDDMYIEPRNLRLKLEDRIFLFENDFLLVDLKELKGKVNLTVTSPPYNVGVDYGSHNDSMNYNEYLLFTRKWLEKIYDLLASDGRFCLNIPLDKNRNGIKSVYADVVNIAKDVGFKYQGTIIWNEQNISRRTAWGSWLSASAPYVIAPVEMIVVLYKHTWKRINPGVSTISREEFIEWTNGVWTFNGEKKSRVNHPAPFPVELPRRCIRLFSYSGDLVFDPFVGSGSTLIAAFEEQRIGIGVEIDHSYVMNAATRIQKLIGGQLKLDF